MKIITQWIVKKTVQDHRNINNVEVRARYGSLEAWTSIVVNVILFAMKLVLALMAGSVSLMADAVHTLSDTGTSIVILFGFRAARRPGDPEHPFGHGRMEAVSTLIVAVLLMVAGLELLKSAVIRILSPSLVVHQISWTIIVLLLGTLVIKELLARFARELGRMINSKTLEADFWHHRSDALSTMLVLVAIVFARIGWGWADGVAGALVAVIVIASGYYIAHKAVGELLGEAPGPELIDKIEQTAQEFDAVKGVHDIIVHRYGQVKLVSLHVEVQSGESAMTLHDLAETVEEAIGAKIGGTVIVHVDPLNRDHERYDEIETLLSDQVANDQHVHSFHDLRIVGHGRHLKAVVDIVLDGQVKAQQTEYVKRQFATRLADQLPDVRWSLKIESLYAYNT